MVVSFPSQDEDPDTSWLLLSEDDLIALFSQFPFDELFKHLLGMSSEGEETAALRHPLKPNFFVDYCTRSFEIVIYKFQALQ